MIFVILVLINPNKYINSYENKHVIVTNTITVSAFFYLFIFHKIFWTWSSHDVKFGSVYFSLLH